jgi:hypothetical protein
MCLSALQLLFLLILLAVADIYLLAQRLSPLQEIFNLPLNGAVGIYPAVCLLAYIGLFFWLPSRQSNPMPQVLGESLLLGLLAGLFIVVELQIKANAATQETTPPVLLNRALLVAAIVVWAFAGLRGGRITGNAGVGLLTGLWSSMVASLVAATAVIVRMTVAGPPPVSPDPWKQYQGLAIGTPATQALVQSLNSTTFYLLVGPIIGSVVGLFFALVGQKD